VAAVDEVPVEVKHIGKATGHASTEVVTDAAEDGDVTTGHVFTAMVAGAFHHGMRAGVAHGKTLARSAGGEQLAAGRAVQAGVADDGGFTSLELAARGRHDHQLAA